ncbi:acyl-CoA dehydrogenase [Paraburkholderia sp. CNPSo 3157]|uniref:Acyl-coenzyme A dehydrogenase n=1 Tax=Paraburkholderia franconis TaxID=2654983 RepID=A0A7X1TI37_9BURK|nr:acyl-CoA dehydrogenase [Paraburkholderia franconis]MPW19844.1 acyl-CoA dehydrogenase [Paraburkholderia franconis]
MSWFIVALIVAAGALVYVRARASWWLAFLIVWVAAARLTSAAGTLTTTVLAIVLIVPALLLTIRPLRRAWVSRRVLGVFRKILPDMSRTERDAIEAGTVWWDAALFSGRPHWDTLLGYGPAKLTAQEQAFLDNECEQLCDLANDWQTTAVWQDLSPQAWQFIKDKGFLGMIIPAQYGGKGYSAYAHSQVIMKLASRCSAAAVSVMVPNSLGPAELLLQYGTDAQKNHYLPRLARGDEIPCFALTSPYAGSDAAAIPDVGIVCNGTFEGRETLGFRVTWSKRYITLGPIATVLGLAFRALDPDRLLGGEDEPGITCALIPTSHPGVNIGRRHWPLNAVFQNGPNWGNDVFIPLDWVIGGRAEVGNGWRMLMECLAAGRAISLPSSNVGMSKVAVRGVGAYAAVRRQFRTPVGRFEGVQEALGRMGGNLYVMDATRRLSAQAVDLGEKPSVISAISKYHITERNREVIDDGMDVLGGKGICMGPSNFLARAYQQVPISITVEGANILTRCLIIFGQGAIRCHPYVLKEMAAAREAGHEAGNEAGREAGHEADHAKALRDFDEALFGHIGFTLSNIVRCFVDSVTGGALIAKPQRAHPPLAGYYRAATRLSTTFALLADVSMFVLGGDLKRRERISARLGDVLSQLYLISATLKRFEDEGREASDLPLVQWGVEDALHRAQTALDGVLRNYPNRLAAGVVRALAFPFGLPHRAPSDALGSAVAELMQTPGAARDRLLADSYVPHVEVDALGYGELACELAPRVAQIEQRLREAIRHGRIDPLPQSLADLADWNEAAQQRGFIDEDERKVLDNYARFAAEVVKVDDFPADFGMLADLQRRKDALDKATQLAA